MTDGLICGILPLELKSLAERFSSPLYVVGGFVRNFLIGKVVSDDCDIAGNIPTEEFTKGALDAGFYVVAVYPRTGTVVIKKDKRKYEYTRFRTDVYVRGEHTPFKTQFTDDILIDARRRDFKCNAVYYDLKNSEFVDPLNGIKDIENKVLDTVVSPERVFGFDGLRLLRLARFSGELGFRPTEEVIAASKLFAYNLDEISVERVFAELKLILAADSKYPFSDKRGHYTALKLLDETRVLDRIVPELTLGRNMFQRADYHKYDVLEHTLKTVLYAPEEIRLAALFHDVGKPYCMLNYGRYNGHDKVGGEIAETVLKRLKAPVSTVKEVKFLTEFHMLDMENDMREIKLKMFIAQNYGNIDKLLKLKQADYSAGKDDLNVCPTVQRWNSVIERMKQDGTPFLVSDLKISGKDLLALGISGKHVGEFLDSALKDAIIEPELNDREKLLKRAEKFASKINNG